MKQLPKQQDFRGLLLGDFLIKPLQRVCKYPLMLKAVLENTPEDHVDFKDLSAAFGKMREVVGGINENTRLVEKRQKVFDIQTALYGLNISNEQLLVTRTRLFIREGPVFIFQKKQKLESLMYLLNDLLLFTRKVKKGLLSDNYREEEVDRFPITKLSVFPLSEESVTSNEITDQDCGFDLHVGAEDIITVLVSSEELRDSWVQALTEAIIKVPKGNAEDEDSNFSMASNRRHSTLSRASSRRGSHSPLVLPDEKEKDKEKKGLSSFREKVKLLRMAASLHHHQVL